MVKISQTVFHCTHRGSVFCEQDTQGWRCTLLQICPLRFTCPGRDKGPGQATAPGLGPTEDLVFPTWVLVDDCLFFLPSRSCNFYWPTQNWATLVFHGCALNLCQNAALIAALTVGVVSFNWKWLNYLDSWDGFETKMASTLALWGGTLAKVSHLYVMA